MAKGLLFFHLLGMALWLGGMFTLGIFTSRSRRTGDARVVAFAYGTAGRLYRGVVAPGAGLSILTGIALMFVQGHAWFRPFPEHWLFQMQILGLVAFLVTVFYLTPNASVLARLAEGAVEGNVEAPEFAKRVRRSAILSSAVGGVLIYLVLLGT